MSEIHDLGYKRYVGTRRAPSTRWRVIMREQIATSWKAWWRFKSALGLAVVATCVAGGFMYFAESSDWIRQVMRRSPVPIDPVDIPLPFAIAWYCRAAFVLSLTVGAGVIAGDLQSGAFTFYFARSVRPRDYLLGKLAGYGLLVALLVAAGPVALAALRIGLAGTDQVAVHLILLPKVLAIGGLATLVYTAVPLGVSALVPNRRYALALWAAYYLIVGSIAALLAFASSGSTAALDLPSCISAVTFHLFDVPLFRERGGGLSLAAALTSIGIHATVAVAIIWYQLSSAQRSGIGGAS
jgi:hypothetical protein